MQKKGEQISLAPRDALLIVDVQNDFLPSGRLPVPHGDEVISVLNAYIRQFTAQALPVYATRDWHPPEHCSFDFRGGPWPLHCVANTPGAAFAPPLQLPSDGVVISKAEDRDKEAYSGFEGTDLEKRLRKAGVERLFVGGLATDYCVLNTVIDGLHAGFHVFLLEDAIRAVDASRGDGERARGAMLGQGAVPVMLEGTKVRVS